MSDNITAPKVKQMAEAALRARDDRIEEAQRDYFNTMMELYELAKENGLLRNDIAPWHLGYKEAIEEGG